MRHVFVVSTLALIQSNTAPNCGAVVEHGTMLMRPSILKIHRVTLSMVLLLLTLQMQQKQTTAQFVSETSAPNGTAEKPAAIMLRMIKAYRGINQYQDTMRSSMEIVIKEPKEEQSEAPKTSETTLRFERPNRLNIEVGGTQLVCDGESLWTISNDLGQFLKDAAPAELTLDSLPQQMTSDLRGTHAVLLMLLNSADDVQSVFPEISAYTGVSEINLDGEVCDRVDCVFEPRYFYKSSGKMSLIISRASSQLRQIEFDLTQAYNDMAKNRPLDADNDEPITVYSKMVTIVKFQNVAVDESIDASHFDFKPDDSVRLVEQFDWSDSKSRRAQGEMIGKPSPDWKAKNLDGQEVTLESMRGKVVLLDFWATWCGPCVAALPHVQSLADRFKNQPVLIVGVNLDEGGPVEKIRKFLARKSVTLAQVLGKEPELGKLYNVHGIPHMVLMDQAGIVQDFRTGFDPSAEEAIAQQIDNLLAGKTIVRHAENDLMASSAPGGKPAGENIIGEQNQDSLKLAAQHKVNNPNARIVMDVDVDGDGQPDLACPDYDQGINLISNNGQSVRRMKLKGLPREAQISSLTPLRVADQLRWLTVSQTYSPRTGPSPCELSLFDDRGELRWTYKPDLPDGHRCNMVVGAADLDGNGDDDPVAAITAFKARMYPHGGYSMENEQGYILVLDSAGQPRVCRRMPSAIEFIRVTPASQDGLGSIFCLGRGQMAQLDWAGSDR